MHGIFAVLLTCDIALLYCAAASFLSLCEVHLRGRRLANMLLTRHSIPEARNRGQEHQDEPDHSVAPCDLAKPAEQHVLRASVTLCHKNFISHGNTDFENVNNFW